MKEEEEYSKKVQQIMNQQPAFIIRWGNLIILIILTILGGLFYSLFHSNTPV